MSRAFARILKNVRFDEETKFNKKDYDVGLIMTVK